MAADLFRQEALEYWSRQRGPGAVLRVAAPWVRWLYWIVLLLVVAGVVLAFFARIEQSISGPVLVHPQTRTFVAVLPAVANPDLQGDRSLRLELDGPSGRRDVAAWALHAEPASDAITRQAGVGPFPQPATLVTGVLAADVANPSRTPPILRGRAVVVLGSQRVFSIFLHGFNGVSEQGNS